MSRLTRLLPDLAPWRSSRDFRLLWLSGAVTTFGNFLAFVAVPVQMKELTGSPLAVGSIGLVELVPLIVFPDEFRGRLAGIGVLAFTVGPQAGQIRAGGMGALIGVRAAVWTGGLSCVAAVGLLAASLPRLWAYDARTNEHAVRAREREKAVA